MEIRAEIDLFAAVDAMETLKPMSDAIHVVIFSNGKGWLVAQCLEYDIATQAKTHTALWYELERILAAHLLIAEEKGSEPFAGLTKAPRKFWQMYKEAGKWEPLRRQPRFTVELPPLELRAA